MKRIANLGMYDPPWLRSANDALWLGVSDQLRSGGWTDVPTHLERTRELSAIWRDSSLLLGQTCGYPLVTQLKEEVRLVGSPVYDLPGCEGTWHHSVLVVAETSRFDALEDLRGRTAAVNGPDSNTGMNLFRHLVAPLADDGRFFGRVVTSGGHLASMELVRQGTADIASIDVVTFELARRHHPQAAAGLHVFARTAQSPTLPFVTSRDISQEDLETLRSTLNAVLADAPSDSPIAKTALRRIEPSKLTDYDILLQYEAEAVEAGYPVLA
jgi:ABC-type phosphate/phosphonate transport system substrate-binding protein